MLALASQQKVTTNAPWQQEWFSAKYVPPLPTALHEWKHHGKSAFAALFQMAMLDNPPVWLADVAIDALLPMPISISRRLERGFNQCDELAAALANQYGWHILPQQAVFRQHKAAQSTLNKAQRLANIHNSFHIKHDVRGLNLLIIDDIFTTGITLTELTRSLKTAGANQIYVWVAARKTNLVDIESSTTPYLFD